MTKLIEARVHPILMVFGISGLVALSTLSSFAQSWESAIVHYGNDGRLVYTKDASGNRIPDFSHAGYMGGGVTLPVVPTVKIIAPVSGDNTVRIQSAIDSVGALPLGGDGIRGALLLSAGTYDVYGTLRVNFSGVVLRGIGDGSNPTTSTILKGKGDTPHQRTILIAGGGSGTMWRDSVAGTRSNILDDTVFIGSRTFRVQNPSRFAIGDNIIIYHPCTGAWLTAIDSGGTHYREPGAEQGVDLPWDVGSQPILYNRFITEIRGDTIIVDAPVFNHLIRSLSQAYIYKYSRSGLRTKIGIENLRIDIETAGGADENHAWDAIALTQIENAWVKNCTMLHFGQAGVETSTATRVTIDSCKALDPISIITGERRYNFNMYTASQQILISNSTTTNGRHDYVSNGTSWTSGCVFLNCTSEGTNASSEGHRRWTTGFLYDNITFRNANVNFVLGLYNRGYYGTSHGWAVAHSVLWNCDATGKQIIVQQPPTAQNYAIGCKGTVTGIAPPAPFNEPQGYIEGSNLSGLNPRSLYLAQLSERLGTTSVHDGERGGYTPKDFRLYQNYPNPFNPTTEIKYQISKASPVTLKVFDVLGREVATLVNKELKPGDYAVEFDAGQLSSGVFFGQLRSGNSVETKRMLLLR